MKTPATRGLRTWIEVDRKAIAHNLKTLNPLLPKGTLFMAIVKSNAYGHSLLDFSREVVRLGADWLGVDSILEASALRKSGVKKPILVLGYTLPEMLAIAAESDVSVTVSTFETLHEISKLSIKKLLKVHIKVDTGMSRQGFLEKDRQSVLRTLKKLSHKVLVEGLYTHLSSAKDPRASKSTEIQLSHFEDWANDFKKERYNPIIHSAASGGMIAFPQSHLDLVRVGASLYGLWPSAEIEASAGKKISLKPALSWRTLIGEVKSVEKGARVGYDLTEKLTRDSKLAICPVGYWHGYPRALSSTGIVLVRGKRARVVGRVSMDMITIDVTNIPGVRVGDRVTIIGTDGRETITADDIARLSHTSSYEIITRINPLIKRLIV